MIDFQQSSKNRIELFVDIDIYSKSVIFKVLYWLIRDFFIYQSMIDEKTQKIILEKRNGDILTEDFNQIKERLNQDFIDFNNREIIVNETKDIRNILYVKAFSNNDDFEDFNLLSI